MHAPNFNQLRLLQRTLPEVGYAYWKPEGASPGQGPLHVFLSRTPLGLWSVHTEDEAEGTVLLGTAMGPSSRVQALAWMGQEVLCIPGSGQLGPPSRESRGHFELLSLLDSSEPAHMREVSAFVDGLDCEGAYAQALRMPVPQGTLAEELQLLLQSELPALEPLRARAIATVLGDVAAGLQDGLGDLTGALTPFQNPAALATQLSPELADALTCGLDHLCAELPRGPYRYPLAVFINNLMPHPLHGLIRRKLQRRADFAVHAQRLGGRAHALGLV